jgi:predicted dehydrogenase
VFSNPGADPVRLAISGVAEDESPGRAGLAACDGVCGVVVRRLSVIQVGAGFWGRSWAEIVAGGPGTRLAALVDGAADARGWASDTLGVPVFGRLERALAAVESDAVLLVSPPATHRPLAEVALAAGRHVVVEKPLAPTLEDARALAAAAARARLHVIVSQNYRFRRQSCALQALVATRALVRLLGVRISCRRDLRNGWISPRDWRARMRHPYLFDMAIHHVDMLRQITGREIAEVDARAWRVPDSPFRHEPTVEALLTLDDGTAVAYEGTLAAATAAETSWNGDWELVGSRARATWTGGVRDALRGTVSVERYGERAQRAALPRLASLDRLAVLHELRRAIADGDAPECAAADNLTSLAAIFALARSVEEGHPVRP